MINDKLHLVQSENCCEPVARSTFNPESEEIKAFAAIFAALSDPHRLAILKLLSESEGEVCVCDITGSFKLGQPTISHHLKILKEAGLVNGDKRGKWVYYSLVHSKATEIKELVDRVLAASVLSVR